MRTRARTRTRTRRATTSSMEEGRRSIEDRIEAGKAFLSLKSTDAWALTLAKWFLENWERPDSIAMDQSSPETIRDLYLQMQGRRWMLNELRLQMLQWEKDGKMSLAEEQERQDEKAL